MKDNDCAAVSDTVAAVVRRRCFNCVHAIIPKRRERKAMPVLLCGVSDEAEWDVVREFDNCCDKWERKASNGEITCEL